MSSLSSILEESEDVFGVDTEWTPAPGGILLSRSKAYRGPNTYKNKRKDILKAPLAPIVCEICLEIRDLVSSTPLCTHHPMVCVSCLEEYLSHAIRVEGLTTLVCPAVKCEQLLGYGDVVKHIAGDAECLDRFNALITQRELERHPDFRWCTNPPCGQGQIYNQAGPIVTCDHCHTQSCFVHKVPWHQGLTCEEYTVERERTANEEYLTTRTKPCPNPTCGRPLLELHGRLFADPSEWISPPRPELQALSATWREHDYYSEKTSSSSQDPSSHSGKSRPVGGYAERTTDQGWTIILVPAPFTFSEIVRSAALAISRP